MSPTTEQFKELLDIALDKQSKDLKEEQSKKMENLEKTLTDKMADMNSDISDIKNQQKVESDEREAIGRQVDLLTDQVETLTARLDSVETPTIGELTDKISQKFSKQIQTAHFQNLTHELRQTETSMMLFGYTPEGGTDLVTEIRQKVLVEKLRNLQL